MNRNQKRITGLFILLSFIVSMFIFPFGLSSIQEQDLSVEYGDNVYQYLPYTYYGTFYDNTDPTFAFTNAKIEFTYIPDSSINNEYDITEDFTNSETLQPQDETNITMTNGEYSGTGNMQDNDDSNAQFDYDGIGVYNATYSFTNDADESYPSGWNVVEQSGCTVNVTSEEDGHKKVVGFFDNSGNICSIQNTFSDQTNGIVEFWFRVSSTSMYFSFRVKDDTTELITILIGYGGKICWYDTDYRDIQTINADQWYHFMVDFDGNNEDFDIYVDGILKNSSCPFRNSFIDGIDEVYFPTNQVGHAWLDAVGYSWDNNYLIGWNREEDARFGDYNATYTFTQPIGTSGLSIDFVDSLDATSPTTKIINGIAGHKKVLYHENGRVRNDFMTRDSGTVEFWTRITNTGKSVAFIIKDGTSECILFYPCYYDGYFEHKPNGVQTEIRSVIADCWYHIKIEWFSDNTYDIWINGIQEVDGATMNTAMVDGMDRVQLYSAGSDHIVYFDAIDYSWTSGYSEGRNRITDENNLLGNYPATYNFENDVVYENPDGFETTETTENEVMIVSEIDGHRKVVYMTGDGTSNNGIKQYFDTPIETGTIEWWNYHVDNGDDEFSMRFYGDTESIMIHIRLNKLVIQDDTTDTIVVNPFSSSVWHHYKLIIAEDTFDVYVDNVLVADNFVIRNDEDPNSFTYLWFFVTNWRYTNDDYIDAIGYSWDTGYNLGDNLNDIYFMGSETFESYNQTVSGNYYGTESFDYYTESGVYYGTYDFRDEVGETGTNIEFVDTCTYDAIVVSELDNHKSIMNFSCDSGSGYCYDNFDTQTSGTVEFWLYIDGLASNYWEIYLKNETYMPAVWGLWSSANEVRFRDGAVWNTIDTYSFDTWYHYKIIFDCSSDIYDVYINGTLYADDYDFIDGADNIRRLHFGGYSLVSGEWLGLDAIGYSWDTTSHSGLGYEVDWNLNPYDIEPIFNGGNFDDIWFSSGRDLSISIVDEIDGHNNVLELFDNHTSKGISFYDSITAQTGTVTIEWWWYISTATDYTAVYVYGTGGTACTLGFRGTGQFTYYDGASFNDVCPYSENRWYHQEVILDVSANTFDWYINGSLEADDISFRSVVSDIDEVMFYTSTASADFYVYVDALGYSWDSEYSTGDNINSYGKQVLDDLESEGWVINTLRPHSLIGISGELGNHKKFINLTDNSDIVSLWDIEHNFDSQTFGTIEYYYYTTDNDFFAFYLKDASEHNVIVGYIRHSGNNVKFYDGAVLTTIKTPDANNEWHHIRIEFDCSSETFSVWIDGTNYATGFDFYTSSVSSVDHIRFTSSDVYSGDYSVYLDAVSYSWDEPVSYFNGEYNYHCNKEALIDFQINIPFSYYERDVMQINIDSRHYTSILTNITFSIYNFTSSSWSQINNSRNVVERLNEYEYINYDGIDWLFDSSGNMRFRYYGFNCSEFNLQIDQLTITIYFKSVLEYEHTLNLLGTWKYRFKLDVGLGSEYIQDWIYFNVIEQQPNFEGISESKYTTRWVLTTTETSGDSVISFSDDLKSNKWSICETSDYVMDFYINPTDDAPVRASDPDTKYGAGGNHVWHNEWETFIKEELPYFLDNYTSNTILKLYALSTVPDTGYVKLYTTSDFDQDTITWNNQPSEITYLSQTYISSGATWYEWDAGDPNIFYYNLISDTVDTVEVDFLYTEYYNPNFRPRLYYYISKVYRDMSNGYALIQTDTTETVGLKSQVYGTTYSLLEGDYFTLNLQTTSDNAQLKLYNDDVLQKTLNILSGNTETSRQQVEVFVDSSVSFDQIRVASEMTDEEYLIFYGLNATHWIFDTEEDQKNLYLEPFGHNDIIANYGNNSLKIYENDILKVDTYVTIGYDLTTYIYQSTIPETVFVSFYDSNNDYLDFNQFKVYINYTLEDETFTNQRLTNREFFVDEDTTIYFGVYDSFDVCVYSAGRLAKTFIDITLPVYSLKIKNEAEEYVEYDLSKSGSSVIKSGNIFSQEVVEFSIASGSYSLDYINHEDDYPRELNFTLSTHKIITINTTYHQIYFSLFTYDGLGIDHDLVRFYINNERKDFGFNTVQSETANLVVLDFFNNTLANETIDASAYSEYNIFVEIYSLIILNQFTYEDIIVNITQVGSGVWMTQIIPKQFGLTYRFLPNVEYNMTIYFTNATLYTSRIVNLTENSHIESFGVATKTPEYPKDVYFSVYTGTGLAIDQQLLKFYIDGDRSDFGFNTIENMIVTLTVKDYFNTTLFNQMINTSGIYEYDILINIYSLKIKNEAEEIANYTITLGSLTETGKLFPQEITEYQLASTNYVFEWTNNEDNSYGTISVNLNEDKLYIINTTYHQVYIALYNFYGVVNKEEVKFYINDTRSDFGFNTIRSDVVNLVVMDFFNNTLYNTDVNMKGLKEFSIYIRAYTLVVNNLYNNQTISIKITRGNITIERIIEAQGWTEFKLFPNIEYEIISYVNDTIDEEKRVDLNETYMIVDFGFYKAAITPEDHIEDFMVIFVMFVLLTGGFIILIYMLWKAKKTAKKESKKRDKKEVKVYRKNYAFDNQLKLRDAE